MQLVRKAYTTAIIAFLMLSLVLAAVPMVAAQAITIEVYNPETDTWNVASQGCVGDLVQVTVTGTTPGGLVKVYWDSVKDWDGKAGFVGEAYAVGTTAKITFTIPEAVQGEHYIIVKDVESGVIDHVTFTVKPKITLSPEKVLPGDTVTVYGKGFAESTNIAVLYKQVRDTQTAEKIGAGDGVTKVFYLSKKPVTKSVTAPAIYRIGEEASFPTGAGATKIIVTAPTGATAANFTAALYSQDGSTLIAGPATSTGGNDIEDTVEFTGITAGETYVIKILSTDDPNLAGQTFSVTDDVGTTPVSLTVDKLTYTEGAENDYTLNYVTGAITFATAPEEYILMIFADYDYYTADVQANTLTNYLGSFTVSFDVPDEESLGTYSVVALDGDGNEASADLSVVEQLITITPESGYVGTTVTVTGRGFTPDGTVDIRWYMGPTDAHPFITVINDYPIGSDGTFTATFKVPTVPDPTAPGDDYLIKAIDSEGNEDTATFTVTAPAKIVLNPTSGKVGTKVTVTGVWFTSNSKVTLTFDGITLETLPAIVYTDSYGSFSADFEVPEVDVGTYTVTATDEEGLSATATFEVLPIIIEIKTRATEYMPGDIISIYVNSTEDVTDAELVITDPEGMVFWRETITNLVEEDGWYMLESYLIVSPPLPSDAPLGDWNFTAYDSEGKILDTNLFTVVERPTLAMILDRIDELDVKLSGLISDAEGNLKAYINTSLGPVIASLDEINATIASINGDVVTIKTDVGTVKTSISGIVESIESVSGDVVQIKTKVGTIEGKVTSIDGNVATISTEIGKIKTDVSDIKGLASDASTYSKDAKSSADEAKEAAESAKSSAESLIVPIWVAVILALVAAIAAIASVVIIQRKIAG